MPVPVSKSNGVEVHETAIRRLIEVLWRSSSSRLDDGGRDGRTSDKPWRVEDYIKWKLVF